MVLFISLSLFTHILASEISTYLMTDAVPDLAGEGVGSVMNKAICAQNWLRIVGHSEAYRTWVKSGVGSGTCAFGGFRVTCEYTDVSKAHSHPESTATAAITPTTANRGHLATWGGHFIPGLSLVWALLYELEIYS